jgi:uncharacterized protein
MKAARAILLALSLGWVFPGLALANVAVPPMVGRVVDQTGTLSGGDAAALNQTLRNFEARKGSQIAVLIVPTTDGEAIEQFSLRVAETWKIGRKKIDDGVLLVVAKNDRHLRIEVGYGLEGALTDVTARRIIDEIITPRFRNGDFSGGISAGVDRIIRVIDGERLPAVEPSHQQTSNLLNHIDPIFALFVLFGFGAVMRNLLGALLGATVTGGIAGALAWYISGSFAAALLATFVVFMMALVAEILAAANQGASRSRHSGWGDSSSSSGGSWSSGSSSSSSDSSSSSESGGGGGSFGGGGASGSW